VQNAIVVLDKASPLENIDTTIDLSNTFLEGIICHVYFLEFLLIAVLQNIGEVNLTRLEAGLCDTWLTILCVQGLNNLQAMLDELYPRWPSWLSLLNRRFLVAFKLFAEPFFLVTSELIEHLLLGTQELLFLPLLLFNRDPLLLLFHLPLRLG